MSGKAENSTALSKEERKRLKKERKRDKKRGRLSTESNTSTNPSTEASSSSVASPPKRLKREDPEVPSVSLKKESISAEKQKSCLKQVRIKTNDVVNVSESSELRVQVAASSSSDPIVVSFPAGLPSSMTSVNPPSSTTTAGRSVHFEGDGGNQKKPPVFTWAKVRKSASRGRVIHGSDGTCTFVSSNDGRGHDGRHTRFYVGLYHKPTATLKLVPSTEKGTVFAMNQSVTSYTDSKSLDFKNLSVAERRRMVFEAFGSQKKKKVLKSQQANIVEMKSVVGAGEGMMKALGKQMDGKMMSESNVKVIEDHRNKAGDDPDGSGKVCFVTLATQVDIENDSVPFLCVERRPYVVLAL